MPSVVNKQAKVSLSDYSNSLVALLKALVEMPTVTTDIAANRAALDWAKKIVHKLPLHVTDFEHDGYSALILTTRRTKHPKVLLSAHIDVVPAANDEFIFREENGRYYGRGVFDMKFAAATYLQLLLDLGDKLPQYDLGVVLTTDEEVTMGMSGARPLVKAGWGGDIIIDPDAITPSWGIQKAAKGLLRYRVTCQGEAGHASRTWQHKNAIEGLMDYLNDLRALFPTEPCNDEEHIHPTFNIGTIQGGQIVSQVAGSASAEVDMRIAPGFTYKKLEQRIHEVALQHPGIVLEHLLADDPVQLDLELKCVKQLQSIITETTSTSNKPHVAHGASEAGFYTAKGMPVLLFAGPGGNNHAKDEWLGAEGLEQFSDIIRIFVEREAR